MIQPLELKHEITKQVVEKGVLIHRYFFKWSDRRNLGKLVLRVELFDDKGESFGKVKFRLEKTKVVSTVTVEENGEQKAVPVYDTPVYIYVDDLATRKAASFQYSVMTGPFAVKGPFEGKLCEKFEDLSMYR